MPTSRGSVPPPPRVCVCVCRGFRGLGSRAPRGLGVLHSAGELSPCGSRCPCAASPTSADACTVALVAGVLAPTLAACMHACRLVFFQFAIDAAVTATPCRSPLAPCAPRHGLGDSPFAESCARALAGSVPAAASLTVAPWGLVVPPRCSGLTPARFFCGPGTLHLHAVGESGGGCRSRAPLRSPPSSVVSSRSVAVRRPCRSLLLVSVASLSCSCLRLLLLRSPPLPPPPPRSSRLSPAAPALLRLSSHAHCYGGARSVDLVDLPMAQCASFGTHEFASDVAVRSHHAPPLFRPLQAHRLPFMIPYGTLLLAA